MKYHYLTGGKACFVFLSIPEAEHVPFKPVFLRGGEASKLFVT
jgi:hypothetical protein